MPQDADASIGEGREDLSSQLADAQAYLSANIIELRQSGAGSEIVSQGEMQLAALMSLRRQIDTASPATLAGIRAEVASCVAAAVKLAQQAQTAATSNGMGVSGMSLVAASEAARAAVTSFEEDYYKKKKFDAYLHFTSPEDEEEFRRREAQRKEEIDKALALNTPEGNARAAVLAGEQLRDAGAHGADQSPDYKSDLDKLTKVTSDLANASNAKPAMKPAQQISASAEPDPLDAIGPSGVLPRDEIIKLKGAGVVVAQHGDGHGVPAGFARREASQRTPT